MTEMPAFESDWTLSRSLSFQGLGLHTGQPTELTLHPVAEPGLYLKHSGQSLPISYQQVSQTRLCTALGTLMTVEHVLAALYGLGISAAVLEVHGPEMPALDGSSQPFAEAILSAGIKALSSARKIQGLRQSWRWRTADIQIEAEPAAQLEVSYQIDFQRQQTRLLQSYDFSWSPENFARQIAPARTFSFENDITKLRSAGLIKGGSLENALVLTETGGSLNPLRFEDEPVRHKILDCLGDLALLGSHLRARIRIERGGHSAHVTMVKTLIEQALLLNEPD